MIMKYAKMDFSQNVIMTVNHYYFSAPKIVFQKNDGKPIGHQKCWDQVFSQTQHNTTQHSTAQHNRETERGTTQHNTQHTDSVAE